MKKILLGAIAIGAMMAVTAPAQARDGCGRDAHRGPRGECRPDHRSGWDRGRGWDRGPGPGRPAWEEGRYYPGRGYYYRNRWYQHRDRHRGDWRYR
jgi:Ni/Co efflux regulator RcnB